MLGDAGASGTGLEGGDRGSGAPESWGDFNQQRWELYDTTTDPSEVHDLAEQHPDKLQDLIALGGRRPAPTRHCHSSRAARSRSWAPRGRSCRAADPLRLLPGRRRDPRVDGPNIRNRSYTIGVEVDITSPEAGGVLFSQGSRFGGHALYVKDGDLTYVYNFVGEHIEVIRATEPAPTGHLVLSATFERQNQAMPTQGMLTLHMRDKAVGQGGIMTQPGSSASAGVARHRTIGRGTGDR